MGVIEAVNRQATSAELHHHIGASGKLCDALAPFIEDFRLSLPRVGASGNRSADVVEDELSGRKGSSQRSHFPHLEVVAPAVEGQVALDEFGEPRSEVRLIKQPLDAPGWVVVGGNLRRGMPAIGLSDAPKISSRLGEGFKVVGHVGLS